MLAGERRAGFSDRQLTTREMDVVRLIDEGLSNKQIPPASRSWSSSTMAERLEKFVETARAGAELMHAVRTQTGKSRRAQLAEISSLRRWRVGAREYYKYRLFDDSRFSPEEKREYTGWRFERAVYRKVNDPGLLADSGLQGSWQGMVDKVLFDCLMRTAGVPTPRILAVFDASGSLYDGQMSLMIVAELEEFLTARAVSGFFAKPARAHSGDGAIAVARIEGSSAHLADGLTVEVEELTQRIAARSRVVVQERLTPHPVLQRALGRTIATVRVVVLRRPGRSQIHRIALRVPTGANIVDNFDGGRTGNLIGWVEPATGRVLRVYAGWGIEQVRLDRHPDTAAVLEGLVLPDWPEAIAVIQRASRALAGMRLQNWDLALTDRGPLMIEVNDVSAQDVLQLAGPPGFLDRELCSFLREQGFDWPYPHPTSAGVA